jgi:hypothetical protein
MCQGSAKELFNRSTSLGDNVTSVIEQLLSDEAKMSGNVATVNLKRIGISQNCKANSCYMPYVEMLTAEDLQTTQNEQTSGQSGNMNSSSESNETQFMCTKTAMFSDGNFCGILDEQQAFALNLLENQIKHTYIPCEADGVKYTLGMRECKGGIKLKVEGEETKLTVNFSAVCQIQDKAEQSSPKSNSDKVVPDEVLKSATATMQQSFEKLFDSIKSTNCDVLSLKEKLYQSHPAEYADLSDSLLPNLSVNYTITLRSSA